MLKIYLSGAIKYDESSSPYSSFGGYKSNIEVQNEVDANLFPNVSLYTKLVNKPEYRAIVLKNEGSTTLTGLKFWIFDPETDDSDGNNDSIFEYSAAYTLLVSDGCGDTKFPYSITSPYSAPYNITFISPVDIEANAISLPNMPADYEIGIWIKRKLKSSYVAAPTTTELEEIFDGTVSLPTRETMQLIFKYD